MCSRKYLPDTTFVLQNSSGKLTDFLSFYTLPSTVMHHPAHQSLKAAYSFYNIHTETPLLDLMNDALIIAKLVSNSLPFVPFLQICVSKYRMHLTVFYILL